MRWERNTGQYESGKTLYLGRWRVGGYHWNASRGQGDDTKWISTCALPGMNKRLGSFENEEKAAEKAELAVTHWLIGSTSTEKEEP